MEYHFIVSDHHIFRKHIDRYAPLDRTPRRPMDIDSGPLSMWDLTDLVVESTEDVDAETMQRLRTLYPEKITSIDLPTEGISEPV